MGKLAPPPMWLPPLQYAVATLDLSTAAGTLYVLLPTAVVSATRIFCRSTCWQWWSHSSPMCPAGWACWSLVLLVLLNPSQPHQLFGVLLAYGPCYYLLPLTVAFLVLAPMNSYGNELARQRREDLRYFVPIVAPRLLAFMVFVAGVLLLLSGATPPVHTRLELLRRLLPLPVLEISHFLNSILVCCCWRWPTAFNAS